jgi:peptidyl-prolyl cis-trans isomerase D
VFFVISLVPRGTSIGKDSIQQRFAAALYRRGCLEYRLALRSMRRSRAGSAGEAMLKTFRENFKRLKWILWAVIAVFVIFVFVDWGMGTVSAGSRETDVLASVGGTQITTGEFARQLRETEERYRQMYGKSYTPELVKALNLPEQVLNGLIDRTLLREECARLGLTATDEELRSKVLRMKDSQGRLLFVNNGAFVGESSYQRLVAGYFRMGSAEFETELREQLVMEKLNRFLTEATFVGDDEVEADLASRTVKAKIEYVLLPSAPPGTAPAVSDAEAEAFFKKDPSTYMQPEKRKAKYLLVETAKVRGSIQVSDAEIAAEYNGNLDAYRKKEQARARHILYKIEGSSDAAAKAKADAAFKKVKGGADFAALARAESEDAGSKGTGGDLGLFERGRMVKEFEEPTFGAQVNEIVGPVKTPFGWHVIQLLEKQPERVQPFPEVMQQIRARLQEQRAGDETKRQARDLADRLLKIGDKPSDDELRRLTGAAVTFNETELVGRNDAPAGIGMNQAFSQALFTLKLGEISDPVTTGRGEALVKLAEIKKAGMPAFADVKAKVVADLVRKKQDDATLAALQQAMEPGAALEAIGAKLSLKVELTEPFGKNGPIPGLGTPRALLETTFAAKPGDLRGPVMVPDRGAVAFRLVERTELDKQAFEAQKDEIRDRLKNQKSSRLLQAMIARKKADSKIEVEKSLLARFGGRA